MKYEIQKIIMENCTIYNFLYENRVLGHFIENDDSKVLVQTDEISIIPIAESFLFEGPCWLSENGEYKLIELNPSPELTPLYEFKSINLENYTLNELKT